LQLEVPKDLSEQAQKQRDAKKEKLSSEVEQLEGSLARHWRVRPCKESLERHRPASSIGSAEGSSIDRIVALLALSWESQARAALQSYRDRYEW
jgi:hypothetical protein